MDLIVTCYTGRRGNGDGIFLNFGVKYTKGNCDKDIIIVKPNVFFIKDELNRHVIDKSIKRKKSSKL